MKLAISQTIRRLRKEKDITQEALAAALGVTSQSVSRWENDNAYPDMELIPAIANYFGVSTDVLFGMDAETKEYRIQKFYDELNSIRILDDRTALYRKIIAEFPKEYYLYYELFCEYRYRGGLEVARANLPEIRKNFWCVWENDLQTERIRFWYLEGMIEVEEEEYLEKLLFLLDEYNLTRQEALIQRYDTLDMVEAYNSAIQTHLHDTMYRAFSQDFCKRDRATYKNARSRIEGQQVILSILDVLRDPAIEIDAWLETRAFAYLRLAGGCFGAGEIEDGFTALETSLQLYKKLLTLPDDTVLTYNSPVLDTLQITVTTEYKAGQVTFLAPCLLNPCGWEWFNCVRETERFQTLVDSVRCFFPEDN